MLKKFSLRFLPSASLSPFRIAVLDGGPESIYESTSPTYRVSDIIERPQYAKLAHGEAGPFDKTTPLDI